MSNLTNKNRKDWRRWQYIGTLATGAAALLFAGCADEAEDAGYTATDPEQQGYTTPADESGVYSRAEVEERAAANQNGADQGPTSADQMVQQQDEQLKSQVMARLDNETDLSEQELEQIEVEVEQNTVTLSGSVPDEETKSQIEEEVRRVEGVASVQNNL